MTLEAPLRSYLIAESSRWYYSATSNQKGQITEEEKLRTVGQWDSGTVGRWYSEWYLVQ